MEIHEIMNILISLYHYDPEQDQCPNLCPDLYMMSIQNVL